MLRDIEKAAIITLYKLKPSLIVTFGTNTLQDFNAKTPANLQVEQNNISELQTKFNKWMNNNLPNNKITNLDNGSYLIDVEIASDEYEIIHKYFEDENRHSKSNNNVTLKTITPQEAAVEIANLWSSLRKKWDLEFSPKWNKRSVLYISDTKQTSTKESITVDTYKEAMLCIAEYGVPNKIYYEHDDKGYSDDLFVNVKDFKLWLKEAASQGVISISDTALRRRWNRIGFDTVFYDGDTYSLKQIEHDNCSYDNDENYISSPLYELIKKNNLSQYFDVCGFDIALTHLVLKCKWQIIGGQLYLLSFESKHSMVHSVDQLLGKAKPEFSAYYTKIEKQKQNLIAKFEEEHGSFKEMDDDDEQNGSDDTTIQMQLTQKYEAYSRLKLQLMKLNDKQSYCDKKVVYAEWFSGSITLGKEADWIEIKILNGMVVAAKKWTEILINK